MTTETYSELGASRPSILKDPDATLDYSWDWEDWLAGDTISSYSVSVSGVTKNSDARASAVVTAWLTGGTLGAVASATCSVSTAAGRIDSRTIYLRIRER